MITGHDRGRVGQSQYWLMMGINILAVMFLLVGGVMTILSGGFLVGILMVLAVVPVGIYFRVIMMRRCRDIGWPPSLPWIMMGVGIVANLTNFGSIGAGATSLPLLGLPMLIALADFCLQIVLGCIRSKGPNEDYRRIFADDDQLGLPQPAGPQGFARPASRPDEQAYRSQSDYDDGGQWDDAIAKALAKHRGEEVPEPPRQPQSGLRGPARPAGGFGRRMV